MKTLELTPETVAAIHLKSGGDGRLIAAVAGRSIAVKLRQCVPWSEPARFVSLRDADDKEVALIEQP